MKELFIDLLDCYKELLEASHKMRTYQRTYFEQRDKTFLIAAKTQEKVVDSLIGKGFAVCDQLKKEEGL